MAQWYETFFGGLYGDVLAATFGEAASRAQAETVARLLELEKGGRVLDIPCGRGRIAIPLARMGFRVTGIDFQPRFIDAARRAAKKDRLDAHFTVGDMREISFEAEFDGAFNWFTSFGYFGDEENLEFLKRVREALKPGGRFAMDVINKPWLLANLRDTIEDEIGGVRIHSRKRWDAAANRLVSETVFEKGCRSEQLEENVRLYTGGELRELLEGAGFEGVALFAGDGVAQLTPLSVRLVASAKRPTRHD
ncbi:MAG: SAM-dependent methyltransferase [Planctomycetota bacterium]|jgi:cyclopropane fatty-acyl-phospholipid synthase-like methyltransferase